MNKNVIAGLITAAVAILIACILAFETVAVVVLAVICVAAVAGVFAGLFFTVRTLL